jgi:hypothetical protein
MTSTSGTGIGVETLADACGELAWVADALFALEGRWSARMESARAVEHLAVHSRLHGWHATLWEGLLPDSASLRGAERVRAPAGWDAALAVVGALGEDADDATRLALLYRGLVARVAGTVEGLSARVGGPSGAAVARIIEFVTADHRRDLVGGLLLLSDALRDEATIDAVARAVKVLDQSFLNGYDSPTPA